MLFTDERSASGAKEAANHLVEMQQSARYTRLPNMRLAVVFEKFWLAILQKCKLVEFRSSKHSVSLEAGQYLLFALAIHLRRKGKDSLLIARVLRVELLHVDMASKTYPREAEDCSLRDLAAMWGVTFVRCFVLESESIRIAHEIANLSGGCEGLVHQIALKSGVPHFCHVSDLGKRVSITLPGGKLVHPIFRRAACCNRSDSHECRAINVSGIGEASSAGASIAGGAGGM